MFILFPLLLPLLTLSILTKEWGCATAAAIVLILLTLHYIRRFCLIRRIKTMTSSEKYTVLEGLCRPFGYSYLPQQDIFTTRHDAWQRSFGYGHIYDKMAPHFNMIFDALPVYFNYDGRTWLIEFWKGQYGINTGAEIGIYHADTILAPDKYSKHMFDVISDNELICMHMELRKNNKCIASLSRPHWWLTCFRMGTFSKPESLSMKICLTFPDSEMLYAFTDSLSSAKQFAEELYIIGPCVSFTFSGCPSCNLSIFRRLYCRLVQLQNLLLCKLFLSITKPFETSADRLLYLYYYAPFAFRSIFTIHKYKSSSGRSRRK